MHLSEALKTTSNSSHVPWLVSEVKRELRRMQLKTKFRKNLDSFINNVIIKNFFPFSIKKKQDKNDFK